MLLIACTRAHYCLHLFRESDLVPGWLFSQMRWSSTAALSQLMSTRTPTEPAVVAMVIAAIQSVAL
jgi:hypothetical protein